MKITDERLSALVGFVYQGIAQLEPQDRVRFLEGLGELFCHKCGADVDTTLPMCWCENPPPTPHTSI